MSNDFITPAYTFTPGGSGVGTVNLSGISGFDVKKLVCIINQTAGVTIYATGTTAKRFTSVVGTTITLFYNTTGMSAGDVLQVKYQADDVLPSGAATSALQTSGNASLSSIDTKTPALSGGKVPVTIDRADSSATVSGSSAVGVAPTLPPVSVSGVDAGGLKRHILTDPAGRIEINTIHDAIDIQFPEIISPALTYRINTAGSGPSNSVTTQVMPGGRYSCAISLPNTTAATVALASCTTTTGSRTIGYTGAAPALGALISGTGVQNGSYVSGNIIPGTSFEISVPALSSATNTLTTTGGSFTVVFEKSSDNSTWSSASVWPKTLLENSGSVTQTNTIGLFIFNAGSEDNYFRLRLSALTTIPQVDMFIDTYAQNKIIRLPYISGLTAAIPTGIAFIPPIDCEDIQHINYDIQNLTGTGQTITNRQSNDPRLGTLANQIAASTANAPWTFANTTTAAGSYRVIPVGKYYLAAVTHTAIAAMTIGGVVAKVGAITHPDTLQTASTSQITGAAAQGATAAGNPVLGGAVAKTAQPTARTDGQVVAPLFSKVGHQVTKPWQVRDLTDSNAAVTLSTTTETTLVTAVASTFNDLVGLIISSTATFTGSPTAVSLDFRDTTAGTVRFSVALPITPGPLSPIPLPDIFKQATVNTNWTVQLVFTGGTTPAIGSGSIRVTAQTIRNI